MRETLIFGTGIIYGGVSAICRNDACKKILLSIYARLINVLAQQGQYFLDVSEAVFTSVEIASYAGLSIRRAAQSGVNEPKTTIMYC